MQYFVYILKCSDASYYIGVTNDIHRREQEHNEGSDTKSYTYLRIPVVLVWHESFSNVNSAIEKEKQLKGWSRKKKEALINEHWENLILFSKSKT